MHFVFALFILLSNYDASEPFTRINSDGQNTYSVDVKITNLRNNKGRIQLQIYRDQESFAKETPWKVLYISKKEMSGNTLNYRVEGLGAGVYGFALLDDENSNKKMDYGLIMPIEGFGFSDYYHSSWSRPKFWDFDFYLKSNHKVKMVVRYV